MRLNVMPIAVGGFCSNILIRWRVHHYGGVAGIDDLYYKYRIVGVSVFSMIIISITFFSMALITECPNEVREGVFARLRCEEYLKIKAGTEKIFPPQNGETLKTTN
jgi:hypothetical protein